MSKKLLVPEDPELRNEFYAKFAASAIYDAHVLIIYVDEQLSSEAGLPSPFAILRRPNFAEKRLAFANFTSQKNAIAEFATDAERQLAKPLYPAIVLYPSLYYGLWGTIFNATSDAKPAQFYHQLGEFVEKVQSNFGELAERNAKLDKDQKVQCQQQIQVMTTQTDGICSEFFREKLGLQTMELQGSCKKFVCSKNCSKQQFEFSRDFRFPVSQDFEVDDIVVRQGLDEVGSVPKSETFVDKTMFQQAFLVANPPKPRKIDPRKAAAEEAARKKAEATGGKKKRYLGPETYPTVWNNDYADDAPENKVFEQYIESNKTRLIAAGSTHPNCPRCQGKLRFNILTAAVIPQAYKTWYALLCKDMGKQLPKEMQEVIVKQHNNYVISKKATVGKVNGGLKTVIIELGYNSTYAKIHQENIRSLVLGKGQTSLVRVARSDDALKLDYPNLEQLVANSAQGADFALESVFFPVVSKRVTDGVYYIFNLFQERSTWIADWDDLKKRNAVYGKKK